jgi:hypothetical protein
VPKGEPMSRQFYSRADRKRGVPRCLMGYSHAALARRSRRSLREMEAEWRRSLRRDALAAGHLPPVPRFANGRCRIVDGAPVWIFPEAT